MKSSRESREREDEEQMKSGYKRDLNQVQLVIELQKKYEPDYQMKMLGSNRIEGLCEVSFLQIDEKSRFFYDVSGMHSLQARVKKQKMNHEELHSFLIQLQHLQDKLQRYLLDCRHLLLRPEYIFIKDGRYSFCFLPTYQRELNKEFHTLTEFFVSQIDYSDKEGIYMAYELHKRTMEENYSLEQVTQEIFAAPFPEEAWRTAKEKRIHQNLVREEMEGYHAGSGTAEEGIGTGEPRKRNLQEIKPPETKPQEEKSSGFMERLRKVRGKNKWGEWQGVYEGIDEIS